MSDKPVPPAPASFVPPVSVYGGPIAELVAQQMLAPPTRPGLLATLNRFEIQRVLGGGGMGVVLLARDSTTGQSVAIKLIKPELVADQQILHRFVKEAGHLQKLKHRNVVPVLEVSDRAAGPYFVMPYFEKGSLAKFIHPGQPLDAVFILDLALEIAGGLQFAHRRGIIHRDLKPANILRGGEGEACLADFGLARTLFNDTMVDVEQQQCEGTAPYMSPGVAAGDAEDTRCDIYAFGALLYEMLTGEPPYTGRTTAEIRRQIIAGPPKPIRQRNPRADDGLATVAEGAMGRELRDRYAQMTDVVADLQRIKEGKPALGPRGRASGGLRQIRRVSPLAWVAAALMTAALLSWIFVRPTPTVKVQPPPAQAPEANPIVVAVKPAPKVQPRWTATIFAGKAGVGGSADGTGDSARFLAPGGVAVDRAGNVYVADTGNNTIRKITPAGAVTTLAGQAGSRGSSDSTGRGARFWGPFGVAVDRAGNVFAADTANNTIRKITPQGQVSTLAGVAGNPGANDGAGDNAQFRNPWSVAVDGAGNVYVADTSNSTIRRITPKGVVSTLAGRAGSQGYGEGSGGDARFWGPHGVAVNHAGHILVADTDNDTIREITPDGLTVTLAGQAGNPGQTDGEGLMAHFRSPQSLAVDDGGNIYVADTDNLALRMLGKGKGTRVTTLAVSGDLGHPDAVAVDGAGNVYVADTMNNVIRKVTPPETRDARQD